MSFPALLHTFTKVEVRLNIPESRGFIVDEIILNMHTCKERDE